jgi:hypothetical protein
MIRVSVNLDCREVVFEYDRHTPEPGFGHQQVGTATDKKDRRLGAGQHRRERNQRCFVPRVDEHGSRSAHAIRGELGNWRVT